MSPLPTQQQMVAKEVSLMLELESLINLMYHALKYCKYTWNMAWQIFIFDSN